MCWDVTDCGCLCKQMSLTNVLIYRGKQDIGEKSAKYSCTDFKQYTDRYKKRIYSTFGRFIQNVSVRGACLRTRAPWPTGRAWYERPERKSRKKRSEGAKRTRRASRDYGSTRKEWQARNHGISWIERRERRHGRCRPARYAGTEGRARRIDLSATRDRLTFDRDTKWERDSEIAVFCDWEPKTSHWVDKRRWVVAWQQDNCDRPGRVVDKERRSGGLGEVQVFSKKYSGNSGRIWSTIRTRWVICILYEQAVVREILVMHGLHFRVLS